MAILAGGLGVLAYATNLLRRTELQTIDARFSTRGSTPASSAIVLVEIDQATLQQMTRRGLHSEFPFPRRYDAQVMDNLRRAGARVIAIDLQFTQPTDEADDNALIEAVGRAHGKVILGATEIGPGGSTGVFGGGSILEQLGARAASVRQPIDPDGVARRMRYEDKGLKTFAVVSEEVATGRSVPASLFAGGSVPIDFAGPPGAFHAIPYYKVLAGEMAPGAVNGKIVIVGASAPILQDVHATATTNGAEMPGPEIWANAISTLARGVPLKDAPGWLDVLLIVLLGVLAPLGSLRLQPLRALLAALAAAVLYLVATQIAFNSGLILSVVYPLLALTIATLGTLAVLYLTEAIERERVHDLFARFVPAEVVDEVVARTDDNLRLGAVERDCTVLFSDLRGFTSFSEKQPAPTVIEVVNCYLNEMTEAILEAGGTLISYMGDGIMALFGAPLEQADHADRALAAATEMIGTRLDRFNDWLAEHDHDHAFAMGVGINSGPVMAGNIGSEQRVEYTALGDTTNTASRLEGMTKGSGHMLFIADSTRERMLHPPDDLIRVGDLEVRGRSAAVPVWTLATPKDHASNGAAAAEE
ncbi:MAG TPA: adenylate/guanylate cyclase domain-containing protein [Solirubrobacteraceae bacterium]|nr:adenylate/guanylate cyclase domain-containing protein [Solirubrobacteraceae bacterium]